MELTKKQEEGLKIAVARYAAGEPYTVISGYAGVGKSTLIQFIITALGLNPEQEVAYITFTGKASEVLREKGCPNAMTAHRLLYYSRQLPNGTFVYRPKMRLEQDYKIIVVDEVSMLPSDMWELLLSHKIYVLACGDPFQIPPIDPTKDNHVLDNPHIFLDEVMRQAKESDIICLSMDIRNGKSITPFMGNDARVFSRKDLVDGMYFWADEIICGTNNTRRDINEYMRKSQGRDLQPEIGDKIICGRNCWGVLSFKEKNPLINGTIGIIKDMSIIYNEYFSGSQLIQVPILSTDIESSNDIFLMAGIDYQCLTTGKKYLSPEEEYKLRKDKRNGELPIEFDYGYAITCHRAQGSQWDKVLVIEENFPFKTIEHARWLYTACTRATKRLTLVLKG